MSLATNPIIEQAHDRLPVTNALREPSILDTIRRLTGALHTTLEVEEQIAIFAEHIQEIVPIDGLVYRFEKDGLEVEIGRRGSHRCSYRLTLFEEDYLGELIFSRREAFGEDELRRIESTLCALLHPLRNGLLYNRAVRAAHRDPLTGIGNRAAFESTLAREVKLARRHQQPLALVAIDIDLFKRVNDTYGHVAGDSVLKHFAEVAEGAIRDSDLLFRYGGEEFFAILANTGARGAFKVAERIRDWVEKATCKCGDHWLSVTASLGVATLEGDESPVELVKKADCALYTAKGEGRNRVRVFGGH